MIPSSLLLPLLAAVATTVVATPLYTPAHPPPALGKTFHDLGRAKAPLHSLAVEQEGIDRVEDGYSESASERLSERLGVGWV